MPDNVMTGKVVVTAPGVDAVFGKVAAATLKTNEALKKLPATSSAATQSLVNLSRVAQDAPYGFIGIANNLNPLLESFQRLKTVSGSTGGALKALAKDLGGAGGIGLALGIASSLLVTFGNALFGASSAAKKAKEETSSFKEAVDGVVKGISSEIAKVQILVSFIEKETTSREQRTNAIKELQSIAPQYFATLDAEKAKVEDVTRAYLNFTQGVQNAVQARVLTKQLEGIIEKRLELERLNKSGLTQQVINGKLVTVLAATYEDITETQRTASQIQDQIETSKLNELKIAQRIAQLEPPKSGFKQINGLNTKPQKVLIDNDTPFFFKDTIKPIVISNPIDAIVSFRNVLLGGTNREQTFAEKFQTVLNKSLSDLVIAPNFKISTKGSASDAVIRAAKDLAAAFNSALSTAFAGSFEALGEGLGNVLSGKDFGAGLIDVFSNLLSVIGKALIQYGIVKEGLDKILGPGGIALPGVLAVGLGVAAIAAASALRNSVSGGGRAAGGGVSAGQGYWVGERGREFFRPDVGGRIEPANYGGGVSGGGMSVSGEVKTGISGKDIVQIITLQLQSNNRLTGKGGF